MWNKNAEGQTKNQPVQSNPTPSTATARQDSSPRPTVFGKSMKIVGEVSSDEEIQLDGDLEGKLELKNRLTIGPDSKVKANIKATEVVVFGTIRGNVEAENRITLRAGATIVGDIKTAGIVIEDGAYFKGGIDISRAEQQQPAQRAASASAGEKR
jgi:cytoskeletal protein CcmA (bactofilin family)